MRDRVGSEDLRETAGLSPDAAPVLNVRDPLFASNDFFDARDLLQIRYEMVRLVRLGQAI